MNTAVTTYRDAFQRPTALNTLRELLRWLALREHWEASVAIPTCECVARHWAIIPREDEVYVEVVTGVDGQNLLRRFPGLSTLPVTPGDRVNVISGVACHGHAFYFGPFAEAYRNL